MNMVSRIPAKDQKEITRAQNIANAKALGASQARVGLVVKLICVALFAAAAIGTYSLISMLTAEGKRVQQVIEQE